MTQTYLTENLSELVLTTPGFDDLLLLGTTVDDDGHEFHIKALDAEATWDNPVAIDIAVQRWLTDGAVASTQGHDNRSPSFKLVVSAPSSIELAAGERALAQRAERIQRGEQIALLTWISAEGRDVAPAAVFEIWTWHLDHVFEPERENRLARMYVIQATAKPWVRSLDLTEAEAVVTPAVPTTISIDTCSSLTNWTGSPNTPTLVGSTIKESRVVALAPVVAVDSLTRTASVVGLGAMKYLTLDMTFVGTSPTLTVTLDGAPLSQAARIGNVSYYTLPVGLTSFTTLVVSAAFSVSIAPATVSLTIGDVSATDTISGVGSNKQLTRQLSVGGSVPTSGSLKVESPSATPLGTVLVYTVADDDTSYSPPMRQHRLSGNAVTALAAAVSGSHETLVTAGTPVGDITFTVPAAQYREGTYAVVGRFHATGSTTLAATVEAAVGGFPTESVSGKATFVGVSWEWCIFGALTLPTLAVPRESLVDMVITLSGTSPGTVTFDELYLLDVTHGAVSMIDCGSSTILWIDSPDADPVRNKPAVYLGTADDRSDAASAWDDQILALDEHDLVPEGVVLLTVTDGVDSALASGAFYQRWHTQPGA